MTGKDGTSGSPDGTWDNPMGTDGFVFIEYTAQDTAALGQLFEAIEQDQIDRGVL